MGGRGSGGSGISKQLMSYLSNGGKRQVVTKMPKGWVEDKGSMTNPTGTVWINNGKSIMSGERKSALLVVNKGFAQDGYKRYLRKKK